SGVYTDAVTGLLNTPVTSDAFQFFPPVTMSPAGIEGRARVRADFPARAARETSSSVTIEPIVGSAAAEPGAAVQVSVQASADGRRVLLSGGGDGVETDAPPFQANVAIPASAAGPFTLFAVGDDGESFAISDPVVLSVIPAGTPASMEVRPSSLSLTAGTRAAQLEALGAYSDGVVRRITELSGTEFVSSDATVATVDSSGRVTAVRSGFATVTVRNATASADVSVAVVGDVGSSCPSCPRVVPPR